MNEDIGIAIEKLSILIGKASEVVDKMANGGGSVLTTTFWVAAGVITAALIAREVKISEFRQAWIDGLRTDISEYMCKAHEWMDLYVVFNAETSQKEKDAMRPKLDRIKYDSFHVLRRVEMRFKPNDDKANNLIKKLLDLLDPGAFSLNSPESAWRKLADEAVSQARCLLKEEWEVTKNPLRKFHLSKDNRSS